MRDPIAWRIVRYLFAAYYIYVGVRVGLTLVGVTPPIPLKVSAESAAFQGALAKTGFVDPALVATYIASGGALPLHRTAPLGVVLLAPVMVIIFLTDTLLDKAWLWASGHALVLLALAWHFRAAYRPLWNYSSSPET